MISAGVSPNQFTFGILLESVGAGGRLKSALDVFNEMRAAGLAPQTSTYNYLIEACAAAPQPNVCPKLLTTVAVFSPSLGKKKRKLVGRKWRGFLS